MWQVPRRLPESAAATTTNTPCPASLCRPTRARPLPVPLHPYTTPVSATPPTRPAPITTMVPTHRFKSCAHPSIFHNTMVQTGRHPHEHCLRFLVRYIYIKFGLTLAEFMGATTAFLRPNWPQHHPAKHPRTHLQPHHQPTEPRPPSFYNYQLHPQD